MLSHSEQLAQSLDEIAISCHAYVVNAIALEDASQFVVAMLPVLLKML